MVESWVDTNTNREFGDHLTCELMYYCVNDEQKRVSGWYRHTILGCRRLPVFLDTAQILHPIFDLCAVSLASL